MTRPGERRGGSKIAVVGSYGAGFTMRLPRLPEAGETVSGGEFAEGPGGKGSNQAIGAARLGADVSLLTAIGDDGNGRAARALWATEGVDDQHVVVTDAATMVGFILVDPSGENRIAIAPGSLEQLRAEDVRRFATRIAESDAVIVSMEIPDQAVAEALRIGREAGTLTVLNPAPARQLHDSVWPTIDVITPNETEARTLLGLGPDDDVPDETLVSLVQAKTGGLVVLTRGARGALVGGPDGSLDHIPASPVARVVDTTGAGDAYTAALTVALTVGHGIGDAARFAAAAGAHSVGIAGAVSALPTLRDAQSFDRPIPGRQ